MRPDPHIYMKKTRVKKTNASPSCQPGTATVYRVSIACSQFLTAVHLNIACESSTIPRWQYSFTYFIVWFFRRIAPAYKRPCIPRSLRIFRKFIRKLHISLASVSLGSLLAVHANAARRRFAVPRLFRQPGTKPWATEIKLSGKRAATTAFHTTFTSCPINEHFLCANIY